MKTIIFALFLLLGIRTSYAQVHKETSILEDLVRRTHQTLRDVATRSGIPYLDHGQKKRILDKGIHYLRCHLIA